MAKTKQTVKLKAPVQIRFKQLANGNQSIYLDYYTGDVIRKENYVGGKRQYEFLKLYLIPERTREDKTKNEATLALAKAIQSKRIVEIQNDAHGFQNTNKSKVNLLDYLESIGKQSAERGSGNYARTVLNTVRALKLFRGDYIAFRDVDKQFLSEFTDFLRQMPKASKYGVRKTGGVLGNNSVVSYYGTLRTAINRAYKEGIITINPTKEFDFADKVRQEPSRREYLTIEELKLLIATPCRHEIIKQAFLFSCLCGLRVSDIRKLTWSDLQQSGGRVQNAENEGAALPADLRRSVEVAAGTRRSERRRFYLSVDARRDGERHVTALGKDSENHQTYLFSHGETSYNLYLIEN